MATSAASPAQQGIPLEQYDYTNPRPAAAHTDFQANTSPYTETLPHSTGLLPANMSPYTETLPQTTGTLSDGMTAVNVTGSGHFKGAATGNLPTTTFADTPAPMYETAHDSAALPVPPPPAEGSATKKKKSKEPRAIDSRRVAHQRNKMLLWIIWLILMVLTAVFVIMAFVTFGRVQFIQDHNSGDVASAVVGNRDLWGILTATMVTPIAMIAFFLFGTYVLIYKSLTESGFTYMVGAFHASAIWLALLTLQSAVTMQAYNARSKDAWKDVPEFEWGSGDSSLYTGTFAIAYVLALLYLFLFLALWFLKGSLKELRLDDEIGTEQLPGTTTGGKVDATGGPHVGHQHASIV